MYKEKERNNKKYVYICKSDFKVKALFMIYKYNAVKVVCPLDFVKT